jgi:hypothetical protein
LNKAAVGASNSSSSLAEVNHQPERSKVAKITLNPAVAAMSAPSFPPGGDVDRRQQLTEEIRNHACAARTELLHPARVKNAIACGKVLSELRELLGHGEWTAWVEKQCGLNRMTANRYIRLASRTDKLVWHMSIREAYIAAGVITPKAPGLTAAGDI